MALNAKIEITRCEQGYSATDVTNVLALISVFGNTDSLLRLIDVSEIKAIRRTFCDLNVDDDTWTIKKKFLPLMGKSLWNQVVKQLKDSHGFTNQGVPPLVFDFNIYEKEPDSEQVLTRLIMEGVTVAQIAREISNYYTQNKFVGKMGKFISNGLESALIASPSSTNDIKGLI